MLFLKNKLVVIARSSVSLLIVVVLFFPFEKLKAQTITETENITVTAIVVDPSAQPPTNGGGTVLPPMKSGVGFSGYAYPGAEVVLLKNMMEIERVFADSSAFFSISVAEPYNSTSIYTLYADDASKERSLLLNYPLVVSSGTFTQVSGIVFALTITTDKINAQKDDSLIIEGYGRPQREITVMIRESGIVKKIYQTMTNVQGKYSFVISLSSFPPARYSVSAQYTGDTRISKIISFTMGEETLSRELNSLGIPGDCSLDRRVNLVDFSILAFWYGRENPPSCIDTNKDGIINLVDFSILAYYWTG